MAIEQIKGWWMPESEQHLREHPWTADTGYQRDQRLRSMEGLAAHTVIDIGAHIGLWARDFTEHFHRVIAYEPIESHRQCLEKNVVSTRLEIRDVALGDKNETITIYHDHENTGHTRWDPQGDVVVQQRRLDDEPVPDDLVLIKIDVEGREWHVLRGAERTIKKYTPRIVLEQKPHHGRELQYEARDLLREWGYEVRFHRGDDWCMEPR